MSLEMAEQLDADDQLRTLASLVEPPATEYSPESQLHPTISKYLRAAKAFKDAGLGNLNYLTDQPETLPEIFYGQIQTQPVLRDMAKAEVPARFHLLTYDLHNATKIAKALGFKVVIIGALTSATENFGAPGVRYDSENILALEPAGVTSTAAINQVVGGGYTLSNQAKVDLQNNRLTSGSGLTPDQLNALLPEGKWLAVDATTRSSLKSILPTGPMGPSRIRPSEIIEEVKITNGEQVITLKGTDIEKHEGLLGITGGIVETTYKILDVPAKKFATFATLNVQDLNPESTNWDEQLANLLAHLYPALNLKINGNALTSDWQDGFLDGVEIITETELKFLLEPGVTVSDKTRDHARNLLKALQDGNSKYGLFITGRAAHNNIHELMESTDPSNPLHTLLNLHENGDVTNIVEIAPAKIAELYQLREDIPTAAKTEAAPADPNPNILRASITTDAVTTISEAAREHLNTLYGGERVNFLRACIRKQLAPHLARQKVFAQIRKENTQPEITLRSLSYGHGHTRGLDLHERETVVANLEGLSPERKREIAHAFNNIRNAMKNEAMRALKGGMANLANDPDTQILSGEKGKLPEFDALPPEKQDEVADMILAAPQVFSWRAVGSKVWKHIQSRRATA